MKNIIIVLSVFLAVSLGASAQKMTAPSQNKSQKTVYVCPMHHDQMSLKSGKCSECGMEMKKITEIIELHPLKGSQPKTKTVTKYVCAMDGATSDKPGKCHACGMDMKKTTETIELHPFKGSQPKTKTITKYVCTMDGSTSDKPGKCPKCGMKMKEK
jgi:DNA-directed RNA polymerase subunit M/transcription elongation factor TFIIS